MIPMETHLTAEKNISMKRSRSKRVEKFLNSQD